MRDTFELRLRVADPAMVVWRRLVELDRHTAAIPMTVVTPAGEHMYEGLGFAGETRFGPVGFVDTMVVRRADPPSVSHPGRLVVEKFGPVAGLVEATVEQVATGTLVVWRQSLRPAWLPPFLRWPAALVARLAYGVGLRRIVS